MIKGFPVNQDNFDKLVNLKKFHSGLPLHKIAYDPPFILYNSLSEAESEGLKYYWKCDEADGSVLYSNTNQNVNLNLYNASRASITFNFGYAREFTGSSGSYMRTSANLLLTQKGIFSFVLKKLRNSSSVETIFRNENSEQMYFYMNFDTQNRLSVNIYKNHISNYYVFYINEAINIGDILFVNFEYDLSSSKIINLYINGNLKTKTVISDVGSIIGWTSSTKFTFAADTTLVNNSQCVIDEIWYFDNVNFSDLSFTPADWFNNGFGKQLF